MILPDGVQKLNRQKRQEEIEEAKKLNEFREKDELIRIEALHAEAIVSNKVSDVEYDEDYDNYVDDNSIHEIPSMALRIEQNKFKVPEIRDFSIDLWNGSPGLKHWGYNESSHER